MHTKTNILVADGDNMTTMSVGMSLRYLPVSVIFSFIVMGLCVVLGGSLLV
jgi:hypothetical protein